MSEASVEPHASPEYRIEELAHRSGATVRTIRAYQDRGLLPRPERRGRANVYRDQHLTRLERIAALLERGYTLSSIKELLAAWDAGRDLGGVLGLVAAVEEPWTDEQATRITWAELAERFGSGLDEAAVREAVELGILEPVPESPDEFLVPSPQELAVAVELHAAGVPLLAIADHVRELRGQVEHIADRFLDFTTEHVFQQYLGHPPTDAEAQEAALLIRRFRPLAQQALDAELARAMRLVATRHLHQHLGRYGPLPHRPPIPGAASRRASESSPTAPNAPKAPKTPTAPADPPGSPGVTRPERRAAGSPAAEHPGADAGSGHGVAAGGGGVRGVDGNGNASISLPVGVLDRVRELVGEVHMADFIAAAVEREVCARRMDRLAIPDAAARSPSPPGVPGDGSGD
ncbi:MerR family transcriptional regulator [Streptomyces sp. 796.1]|uniref:MerR family transcriptional regulator n=1 Tax=Streptomyces sp. 796.1 TaxID=3163029 RepID=UPI0039C8C152